MRLALISVLLFMGTACANLVQRSEQSGYSNGQRPANYRTVRAEPSSFSTAESPSLTTRTRLKQLENSLQTRKEVEQYSKALPLFKNDEEKIEFLSISTFEARQSWLDRRKFMSRANTLNVDFREIVDAQDIALGMTQNLVRKSWGEPTAIEYSGNPLLKNERWKYQKFVSTPDGYKSENKLVYFEGGKVIGWEID